MKIKFGSIVVEGRGKIGGHVASKNRSGNYIRTKITPVNPRTSFQSTVRTRLADLSQQFKTLTQAQISAWNAAVKSFANTDIFGDIRNPSGLSLFIKLNSNLLLVGQPTIQSPPEPAGTSSSAYLAPDIKVAGSVMTLQVSEDIPMGMSLALFATPPQSAGKNFVKSEFRFLFAQPESSDKDIVITADYVARFGSFPPVGSKVFFGVQYVNIATGQKSPMQICFGIVAAV